MSQVNTVVVIAALGDHNLPLAFAAALSTNAIVAANSPPPMRTLASANSDTGMGSP